MPGSKSARVMPYWARAFSMLPTATRKSRLWLKASATTSRSCGLWIQVCACAKSSAAALACTGVPTCPIRVSGTPGTGGT